MKNEATVTHQRTQKQREKNPTAAQSTAVVTVDVLLGDGNANVTRSRGVRHALPYSEFAVDGLCSVSVRCNQDEETILAASAACIRLAEQVMQADDQRMRVLVNKMAEELHNDG